MAENATALRIRRRILFPQILIKDLIIELYLIFFSLALGHTKKIGYVRQMPVTPTDKEQPPLAF